MSSELHTPREYLNGSSEKKNYFLAPIFKTQTQSVCVAKNSESVTIRRTIVKNCMAHVDESRELSKRVVLNGFMVSSKKGFYVAIKLCSDAHYFVFNNEREWLLMKGSTEEFGMNNAARGLV